ncbi:MAG: GNAT family N-acetyltransferase [Sphingomonadales bacterium]
MSASPYSIREAGLEDIPLIRSLCEQVWPATYSNIISNEQLLYMMDWMYSPSSLQQQINEGCCFVLLYSMQEPVGYASYQHVQKGCYKLHKLYILPSFQGQGAGSCLLNYIHEQIKVKKGQTIELQVNRQNKARYFYETLGYRITKEVDIAVGHGFYMNDYIMVLQLVY